MHGFYECLEVTLGVLVCLIIWFMPLLLLSSLVLLVLRVFAYFYNVSQVMLVKWRFGGLMDKIKWQKKPIDTQHDNTVIKNMVQGDPREAVSQTRESH